MQKKVVVQNLYKELTDRLTDRPFLKSMKLSKKAMLEFLQADDWKENISQVLQHDIVSCKEVLLVCEKTLNMLAVPPKTGWLTYIYHSIASRMFPENPGTKIIPACEPGRLFYLEVLSTFLNYEKRNISFSPFLHIEFLKEEELKNAAVGTEYQRLMRIFREDYFYEFMRIGTEITRHKTLAHISGVHYISMHVAKQLHLAEVPIDLALVSGAAVGHDIGKYGCKPSEAKRIPYLHYFYTDRYFKKRNMPVIGHIATNHSTWDLELENLSVESLVLIYADFRVKSKKDKEGKEVVHFFSLDDSFDVILSKLDNVDEAKKDRYMRVYAKLKDFEDYMENLGINTDLTSLQMKIPDKKEASLLRAREVVQTLKHLAIENNIALMHKLNSETAFANILEAARSEKNWKNIRAYINIFEEYFTYMTQKQKIMTLNFLYELLMHREGDIRRQAADLIGNIIVHYDVEYRKEIPEGVTMELDEVTSLDLWRKYLEAIILPDHKVTDQHKRWIGYALKLVVGSVFERCKKEDNCHYLNELLSYYDDEVRDESTSFILLDSMLVLPLPLCGQEDITRLLSFVQRLADKDSPEVQIAVLRFLQYISENLDDKSCCIPAAEAILSRIRDDSSVAIAYLKYSIGEHLNLRNEAERKREESRFSESEVISDIFLENLKVATPWVIKSVNIELLLDQIAKGRNTQVLHVATHLSNLIKVSSTVAVRHSAGKALLSIAPGLSLDQINEVVIELTKGLEIGEYEFSKYIPEYLGVLALYLHPNELDESIYDLKKLLESNNDRVCSVTLHTLGVLIQHYPVYRERFQETYQIYEERRQQILGMILKGFSNYHDAISQEAFLVIGKYIFGSRHLTLHDKYEVFQHIYKKMLTLFADQKVTQLSFYNRAASLNHIYRFIADYTFHFGEISVNEPEKVAFFPGTFDPFALSHKGIVKAIKELGFEVYLALDEFSWSKKTQPRMIRRKIINMSVAGEDDVYLFPDDIPVNIANPADLRLLKSIFTNREIYIVVGSDVVREASSYLSEPEEDSIHHFNHLVFKRASLAEDGDSDQEERWNDEKTEAYGNITGEIIELSLPVYLEDISSTRIRENIDYNRDISNLIDPLAQNYIYDNSLYLREPQYKHTMDGNKIYFEIIKKFDKSLIDELSETLFKNRPNKNQIREYLQRDNTSGVILREAGKNHKVAGIATFHQTGMSELYHEFGNIEIASYVRRKASGNLVVLSGMLISSETSVKNPEQLTLAETLAYCLKNDFTYAIYHDRLGTLNEKAVLRLKRQGFFRVRGSSDLDPIFAVDMKSPITVFQDIETIIKEPFHQCERVRKVVEESHERFQLALTKLYPGNLILSFDAEVMHHRIAELITTENQVPAEPQKIRILGRYMCVPFGKILRGMAVPNTVTKSLHTEKIFEPEIDGFQIREFPYYSPLENQIKTIKSFRRPVLLVDDLLHKGYRMKELDPLLKKEEVDVHKIIVGILSGRGKDLMTIQGREVECVYFIPNLLAWFDESSMYPFIGGDGIRRKENVNTSLISSVNLILPYAAPNFLADAPKAAFYHYSMTCLENAKAILSVLEEEYQSIFERNLTLNRLSEAIVSPRCPDKGVYMSYDQNLPPSIYLANDIEKLKRLRNIIL
ncbi:hypothetical protein [Sinanaerobacter chloroacetimidivorans]|uniref:nicotinate-nucleotide adenylyltransferase n=1 Tax=Sinanaerobacter chloroacetimidivorans TaxID=2818044 RepID=A0A8J7W155_9FIRM|nr:hypothetical protein [Sinanaerobacter chloroacetimidivorans]MBR0598904.1 hypothetical protein [Sinanaerobacter chloroacetimidivorans]